MFGCNGRCDQENLIAQLAEGVRALAAPVDNLLSNAAAKLDRPLKLRNIPSPGNAIAYLRVSLYPD